MKRLLLISLILVILIFSPPITGISAQAPPDILFVPPTPRDNATINVNYTEINVSVSSEHEVSSFINWDNSLVGYWDFNDGNATDKSTNHNDGALKNGPQQVVGKFGNALQFDGDDDYIDFGRCADNLPLNNYPTEQVTITAWVKLSSDFSSSGRVLGKVRDDVALFILNNKRIRGFIKNESGTTVKTSGGAVLNTDQWYFVAMTYNGSEIEIFLDGASDQSAPQSGLIRNPHFVYQIGGYFFGCTTDYGGKFNGVIDEVQLWNRALSVQEIRALYNTQASALSNTFTNLQDRTYQYYACTTDIAGYSAQTETRTLTVDTSGQGPPANNPPVAADNAYSMDEGGTLDVAAPGVLDNDTDAEGDILSAIKVSEPAYGTLTLNADGSFSYEHDGSEVTADSFTYRANDGAANSNTATVIIAINPLNDPPVAKDDAYGVDKGGTLDLTAPGVLANDTDAEGDSLSLIKVSDPAYGTLTLNPDGSLSYGHDGGEAATDNFTYKVNDGTADSNTATVRIITGGGKAIFIDHTCRDITQIPESEIVAAKANLHIGYGYTSHGSQLTRAGMKHLVEFANGGGLGLSLPEDIFAYNNGGADGALDLEEGPDTGWLEGDCGLYPQWVQGTVEYLNDPSHSDVNVIMWSWCREADDKFRAGTLYSEYLEPMTQLELDYPDVTFVYMTGTLGLNHQHDSYVPEYYADIKAANQLIRDYCLANGKVLYDFEDIESWNPDGNYYPFADEACNYYDSADDITPNGNWAVEWQNTHTQGVDWYSCAPQHSQPLNGNLKAYAAWWLFARLAGWKSPIGIQPPLVTTQAATYVEETTATLNGIVTYIGGESVTRGFEWDTDPAAPYADNWTDSGTHGAGAYTYDLMGLNKGDKYVARATANNTAGWDYGSVVYFMTKPDPAANFDSLDNGTTWIFLSWANGTGMGYTEIRYQAGAFAPTDNTSGSAGYWGSGTSANITGLNPNTTHSFRIFTHALEDSTWSTADSNPAASVTTDIDIPVVTNGDGATDITNTSARLNGEITYTGGENPEVTVFYGAADGGTDPDSWSSNVSLGVKPPGTFYLETGDVLTPSTVYYYRMRAVNSVSTDWADSSANFTTTTETPSQLHQLIIGGSGSGSVLPRNRTAYMVLQGGITQLGGWQDNEYNTWQVVAAPGTLNSFLVETNGGPGAGESFTFTIRVNGASPANGPVTTISGTNTQGLDRTHSVTVVPGDYIDIQCVGSSGAIATRWARWSCIFIGTNANDSLLLGGNACPLYTNSTRYWYVQGGDNNSIGSITVANQVIPTSGVISDFYVRLSSSPGVASDGYRFRLNVNGVLPAGTLDATVTAPNTTASDLVNSVSVSPGDLVCIQVNPVNTPANAPTFHYGFKFTATVSGESLILGGTANSLNPSAKKWVALHGVRGAWAGVQANQLQGAQAGTILKKLYIWVNNPPGLGNSWRFKEMVNTGDSGLQIDIADMNKFGCDLVHTYVLADYDDLCLQSEPLVGTPAVGHAHISLVGYVP